MSQRNTKYTTEVMEILDSLGHATNLQIAKRLRSSYPRLSDTTVHRVTARLLGSGKLSIAPSSANGCMRYDFNTHPHDHFICEGCDGIRDIDIVNQVKPLIHERLGGCTVGGRLTISGLCSKCNYEEGDK